MREILSPPVRVERAIKAFGATRALDGVSFAIAPGQFVAVIGRSGAGKTTLLRCLSRAIAVTEGVIAFGDRDLASLRGAALRAHRADVGMIYQQFNLVKRLRVIDNVLIGRLPHLRGLRRALAVFHRFDRHERGVALRCLEHVGLVERVWQRTDTLSGGEQQRVAIARLLAQQPTLILGDEPVASLDVANGALVMETLRHVASEAGLTVVTTLHHVEYARCYADRILGLRDGRLVFDGPPAALTETSVARIFGELPSVASPRAPAPLTEPQWVPAAS